MSKPTKTAEQYSHDIKLLKYYLEEAIKQNNALKYRLKQVERDKKATAKASAKEHTVKTYKTDQVAKKMYRLLKDRGIPLSAVFRMADAEYAKEITNETLIGMFTRLRLGVTEQETLQVVFAMDTTLNGKIDEAEFKEFVNTYGVGDESAQTFRLEEQAVQKFLRFLKEKQLPAAKLFDEIDSDGSKSIDSNELRMYLKQNKGKLNENEIFLVLNHLDPQKKGVISQKTFESFVGTASKKEESKKANDQFEKEMKKLVDKLKESKINPIAVFEEADADKMNGVTTLELEAAFKKIFPKESQLQIRKWVGHINYNGDKVIDREEFLTAMNAVYSQQDVKGFNMSYSKKKGKQVEQKLSREAVDKLVQQLSQKIEDSGLTKKEVFLSMDKSGDGKINRNQLVLGLKSFGLHVALVNNLLKVFDRDGTDTIEMAQFLTILGEDVEVSDIDMPEEPLKVKQENKKPAKQQPKKQTQPVKDKKEAKKPNPSPEPKKNVSPEPKPIVKKESKNPSDPVKTKQVKKELPKKTFEEDQVFSQHEDAPGEPKKPEKELLTQQQLAPHLEKLSGFYRKNKQKALAFFTKYDKKSTDYVNEANFKTIMKQVLGFSESVKEQLVVDSLFSLAQIEEAVNYKLWLEEVAQNYQAVKVGVDGPPIKKDSKSESVKRDGSVKKEQPKPKAEEKKPTDTQPIRRTDSTKIDGALDKKLSKKESKPPEAPKEGLNLLDNILNIPTQSQRSIGEKKRGEQIAQFIALIAEEANKPATATLETAKATMLNYIQFDELKLQDFYIEAKKLKDKKGRYSDKTFMPERNSITRNLGKMDIDVTSLEWEHITKLFKGPLMFKNSAHPNDIQQGMLGDCYLLSSLSSIAEYPSLAERIVEYEDNQSGLYGIWLCLDGEWQLITVDGWLVVRSADKRVAFSYSNDEELWVSIIEKAYAKAYGNFQHINGGRTYQAIRDLTGAPGKRYEHTNQNNEQVPEDELWNILVDADKKQFMMTAGTDQTRKGVKKEGHAEDVTELGIALGHAYSILDVREVRGERLIKLRNPWGKTEWKGDWSDKSARWTKELRTQLDAQDADDGVFWMPFSNFYWQEFQVTCINFIRPTYYYRTVKPAKGVLQFVVRCQPFSHGYITVSQRDLRHSGETDNTKYSRVSIATFGMKGDKVSQFYNNEGFGGRRDACIQISPKAGQDPCVYIIVERDCQFNLNYYGKEKITLKIQPAEDILESLLMTMVPKDGFIPQKNFSYFLNNFGRYFFFCVRNNHAIRSGTFKVEITKSEGIEILEPQKKGTQNFSATLEPGETKVIRYRITGSKGYSIASYSVSAQLD